MTAELNKDLHECAFLHLLGECDAADMAHEIADDHPEAWEQLSAEAKKAGLRRAADAEEDDANAEQMAGLMRHLMNTGAIEHELHRLIREAERRIRKQDCTPPITV